MPKVIERRKGKKQVKQRKVTTSTRKTSMKIPFEEALELFVVAKKAEGMRPRTIEDYYKHIEWLMNYFQEFHPDIKTIDQLSPDLIRKYINYLKSERKPYQGNKKRQKKKKGLAPNTINIRLRTLRTMCGFWTNEGYLEINPMANINIVKTDGVDDVNGFTEDEIKSLLDAVNLRRYSGFRDKTMMLLMLDTGIRVHEVANIKIQMLDKKRMTLTIPAKVAKSRRARTIPVSRKLMSMLLELHEESEEYFGSQENIFITSFGDPIREDTVRRQVTKYAKIAGVKRATPHMFRHTFARDYILNGGDIFTLQIILDHKNIETTRRYIQMDEKHVKEQHMRFSPASKYI